MHGRSIFFVLLGTITLIYDYDYGAVGVGIDFRVRTVCLSICLSVDVGGEFDTFYA